jgi:nitroreductase
MSKDIFQIISERRAIFPKTYTTEKIPDDTIRFILEQANFAPTHKLTEPWRFQVFTRDSLVDLSNFLADYYQKNTAIADFSDIKYKKTKEHPLRASHVLAICMQRNEIVPEWEEIASVGMAVQNMWLAATALGIGAYWSSPPAALSEDMNAFLGLAEGQKCLGLFYMGHHVLPVIPAKRSPIENKVIWR